MLRILGLNLARNGSQSSTRLTSLGLQRQFSRTLLTVGKTYHVEADALGGKLWGRTNTLCTCRTFKNLFKEKLNPKMLIEKVVENYNNNSNKSSVLLTPFHFTTLQFWKCCNNIFVPRWRRHGRRYRGQGDRAPLDFHT